MHFYIRFVLFPLALAIFATIAVSLETQIDPVVGAVYFINNDPSENQVIAVNIASDGKLGPIFRGVSTSGRGGDPLFSQGSVEVNSKAGILVTVNAGSDTIAMFSIDPYDPTILRMVGSPVRSGGQFPQAVAINSEGNMVCALNGGAMNGVNCFTAHPIYGLIPRDNTLRLLNVNETTPPSGPPGSLSQVIFTPDDSRVIASVKGIASTPGFLATWAVTEDGLSREAVKSIGGIQPFSMTPIPGTNAILTTDPGIGFDIFNFVGENGLEASLTSTAIPGQLAVCWSAFSSKSGNFYLIDLATAIITEVHVDKNLNGSIVKQYQQAANSGTVDSEVATVGKNDFLYVLAAGAATIDVLLVNTAGMATAVQTFDLISAGEKAGIPISNITIQGMATYT